MWDATCVAVGIGLILHCMHVWVSSTVEVTVTILWSPQLHFFCVCDM